MKILLASKEKFLIKEGYNHLGIPKDKLRIGRITTAIKGAQDENFKAYMEEYRQEMIKAGIYFEEMDIKDKSTEEIYKFFEDKNVIQVEGGNPFYLIKYARETGFEKILKDLLAKGLIYVGCSSGSHLMSPSIVLASLKKGRNWYGVSDFTAFAYVPYLVRPHYVKTMDDDLKKIIEETGKKIRLLTDEQAILLEDGKETFIGGPEIILN
ncbi:MAG: Type 1 glutamine amidotransferase-like domain-containing protein [Candidatus Falkowbacteria bacterium]|nr:Type 1 glutamine amidotransferase-like domain-containing protein [Candidatus Falkowbacteria bacterium]